MKHEKENIKIGTHECIIFSPKKIVTDNKPPENLFLQPVNNHDVEELEKEITYIETHISSNFIFVAIRITKWNEELTPWGVPPIFGKTPFGEGASNTLLYIKEQLLPYLLRRFYENYRPKIILGGYSLAGLFTLWTSYNTDFFNGIVSASPSIWYKDWLKYAEQNTPKVKFAYLSLGDKEDHTKTKIISTVKECMAKQIEIYQTQGVNVKFDWNEGNHFQDNGERTAKGFVHIASSL